MNISIFANISDQRLGSSILKYKSTHRMLLPQSELILQAENFSLLYTGVEIEDACIQPGVAKIKANLVVYCLELFGFCPGAQSRAFCLLANAALEGFFVNMNSSQPRILEVLRKYRASLSKYCEKSLWCGTLGQGLTLQAGGGFPM